MKKIDLGQMFTILANVGVIAGIAFLAVEIRDGTRATQAASIQTASALDQEFLLHIAGDPETARIWLSYLESPQALSDEEKLQGGFLFAALIRRLENIYLQNQLGAMSEEGWQSRQDLFIGMATSPGYLAFLEGPTVSLANQQFIEYMNQVRSSVP